MKMLKALYPGQNVVVNNCSGAAVVVERLNENLYRIALDGREVTLNRVQLCVSVYGRWMSAAKYNEIL